MTSKVNIIIISLVVVIFGAIFIFSDSDSSPTDTNRVASTDMDNFTVCLAENGARLFGAWWCPHCEDQREAFGESQSFLPYTECSSPGSRSQNLVCKREEIQVYPSWKFADGTTIEGVLSFSELSEITDCPLPESEIIVEEGIPELSETTTTTENILTNTETVEVLSTSTEDITPEKLLLQ